MVQCYCTSNNGDFKIISPSSCEGMHGIQSSPSPSLSLVISPPLSPPLSPSLSLYLSLSLSPLSISLSLALSPLSLSLSLPPLSLSLSRSLSPPLSPPSLSLSLSQPVLCGLTNIFSFFSLSSEIKRSISVARFVSTWSITSD